MSDSWLLQYVVPNICTEYARDVALVLAPPLLWAVFEPTLQTYLPQSLTRRIKAAYEIICPLQQNIDNNNPVERRLIVVNGSEAQVYIDEVGADVEAAVVDNSVAAGGTTKIRWLKDEVDNKLELLGIVETRSLGYTPSRGSLGYTPSRGRHNME